MDAGKSLEFCLPDYIVEPLLVASDSSTLDKALVRLIEISKTPGGRSDLASKNVMMPILKLCQSICYPPSRHFLLLSLKLLRNLCAGELDNQNLFIEQTGVGIVSSIINSVVLAFGSDIEIIRISMQLLGNVSLAGEEHQHAVWHHFFPLKFLEIVKVRSKETCDPSCMVIYTCCEGNDERLVELFTDQGLHLVVEIIRTAAVAGFKEDWLKLLLSRICLDKSYFSPVFSKLSPVSAAENHDDDMSRGNHFGEEHAFLLSILSRILSERIMDVTVSSDFALSILGILRNVVGIVDFVETPKSGLPTGLADVDVLGYSLTILRDICAHGGAKGSKEDVAGDNVDMLVSSGLVELLLSMIRDLEPPLIIRKTMRQSEKQEVTTSSSSKHCPYKGFRRDVVAIIGNCSYHRKHVQNNIREKDGILLLLQQCVIDEDNPFLREWGIWSVRNILEGNIENQQVIANLELQGSVDVPEIAQLGLQVQVDPETRRAKLVNV